MSPVMMLLRPSSSFASFIQPALTDTCWPAYIWKRSAYRAASGIVLGLVHNSKAVMYRRRHSGLWSVGQWLSVAQKMNRS